MHARIESTLPGAPARSGWPWSRGSQHARRVPAVWRAWLAPFSCALLLRLLAALVLRAEPAWDGAVYARAAEQLAAGQGYTLRVLDAGNDAISTAFYPVGYPALLAVVRAAGAGLWGDRLFHALCSALHVPLAFLLARRAFGARAARWAAWITAFWPGAILFSATWLAEPVFGLACGVALLPVLYAGRARLVRSLIMSAILLGLAAYIRPSALPIAALLGAFVLAQQRDGSIARRALYGAFGALLALSSAGVAISPWLLRNQRELGAPVLVSTNGGVNLLIGALEEGGFERLPEPQPCRRDGLTEVQRDRCFTRQAIEVIRGEPWSWTGRGLLKLAHTFGHQSAPAQAVIEGASLRPDSAAALWLLGVCRIGWLALLPCWLLGAAVVLARAVRSRVRLPAIALLAPLAAIALLHTVFLGGDRYHGALAPIFAALAAIGVLALARSVHASAGTDSVIKGG